MRTTLVVATTLTLLLGGCAKDPTRETALLLVDEINGYEQAVGAKIAAERRYYGRLQRDERDAARRVALDEQRAEYLRTLTELTDQAVEVDKNLRLGLLQRFLRENNERGRTAEADRAKRAAELERAGAVSFAKVSSKRRELEAVRRHVMKLAREESSEDRAERLVEVVRDSAKLAIERRREGEGDSAAGPAAPSP